MVTPYLPLASINATGTTLKRHLIPWNTTLWRDMACYHTLATKYTEEHLTFHNWKSVKEYWHLFQNIVKTIKKLKGIEKSGRTTNKTNKDWFTPLLCFLSTISFLQEKTWNQLMLLLLSTTFFQIHIKFNYFPSV